MLRAMMKGSLRVLSLSLLASRPSWTWKLEDKKLKGFVPVNR
jgi:hypothetical protein